MDIKELKGEGQSVRSIARETGHSRNTVRKVLRGEHSQSRKEAKRGSKLDDYKDYVKERFEKHGLSAVRIHEELVPMGYEGSVQTVRRYVQALRGKQPHRRVTVRFETPPGKQAQADWAFCGRFEGPEGKNISVYVFVMVLAYSRQLFVHFTRSMRVAELIRCHQLAFEYFGGWPAQILYDNMKQVRIGPGKWNEQFLDFANHHGFALKTHRPYRPRTKGKVERAVDYVKGNFLTGRTFHGFDDLNAQARHWLEHTANVRVHGTTKKRPCDLVGEEGLTPLEQVPVYHFASPVSRVVNFESMIQYAGSRYSVPPSFAGETVSVAAQGGHIHITVGDMVVAEHREAVRPGQSIVDPEHIAELWKITNEHVVAPPKRSWEVRFRESVETMPLSRFEEVLP